MGKDIKTFHLPAIIDRYDDSHGTDREVYEEETIEPTTKDVAMKETLNEEQRNIEPANGLCNDTRLVVRGFQKNSIDAEIVLGQLAKMQIFLPRIPLFPSKDEMFPFQFKRKQFLIRLSFAMMVNKAQGQTIPKVGVYLPEPVFSHGQLYVALSRATARSKVKILVIPVTDEMKKKKGVERNSTINGTTYTKNIVYKEVLTP
eukprot:XP_008650156.1 uncharacterized protein LOC103630898 [Zea mays]